ncbi:MAG: glycosyltransferase family 2 protein [Polyangiaceae bacterium]
MFQGLNVAVVIPAFDEQERIVGVVTTLPAFVDRIIVVDDASRDRTSQVLRELGAPRVELIVHDSNRGVGASIVSGYRAARRERANHELNVARADVIVVMAGDGQMDPSDLPALLIPIAEGRAEYVKGNRIAHARASDMPPVRRYGSALLGVLTSYAVGAPGLGDSQCGYTAISGSLVDRLPLESLWPRYGYPNDLLSQVCLASGRVIEVPVRPVYAGQKSGLKPRHFLLMLGLISRAYVRRARQATSRR